MDGEEELLKNAANDEHSKTNVKSRSPWRWVILCMSSFVMFSSYYCYDNPSALFDQVREQLACAAHSLCALNREFGVSQSAHSLKLFCMCPPAVCTHPRPSQPLNRCQSLPLSASCPQPVPLSLFPERCLRTYWALSVSRSPQSIASLSGASAVLGQLSSARLSDHHHITSHQLPLAHQPLIHGSAVCGSSSAFVGWCICWLH